MIYIVEKKIFTDHTWEHKAWLNTQVSNACVLIVGSINESVNNSADGGFGLKYKSDGVTGVIVATYQHDKL